MQTKFAGGDRMIDLRRLRQERGLTLKQLGEKANLDDSYICLIEQNKRTPSVPAAKRIAKVLGFNWTRFFDK